MFSQPEPPQATQPWGICQRPPDHARRPTAQAGGWEDTGTLLQQKHQKSLQQQKAFWIHKKDVRSKGNCRNKVGFHFSGFKWGFLTDLHFNPIEDPLQSLAFS